MQAVINAAVIVHASMVGPLIFCLSSLNAWSVENKTSDKEVAAPIQFPQVSRRKVAKHRAEVAHSPVVSLGAYGAKEAGLTG